jgi:hypothetical protein
VRLAPVFNHPYSAAGPTNTVQMFYSVGGTAQRRLSGVEQQPDYYVNIINVSPSTCQSAPACDMFVDFTKPRGL